MAFDHPQRAMPGFTLIEILIALALSGILMAIVFTSSKDMIQAVTRSTYTMAVVREDLLGVSWIVDDIACMVNPGWGKPAQEDQFKAYHDQVVCIVEGDEQGLQAATWLTTHAYHHATALNLPVRVTYIVHEHSLLRFQHEGTISATEALSQARNIQPGQRGAGVPVLTGVQSCHLECITTSTQEDQSRVAKKSFTWPQATPEQAAEPAAQPQEKKADQQKAPQLPEAMSMSLHIRQESAQSLQNLWIPLPHAIMPLKTTPTPPKPPQQQSGSNGSGAGGGRPKNTDRPRL